MDEFTILKLQEINEILSEIVASDSQCNQCMLQHKTKDTCFCFFSLNCLLNNFNYFKEKEKIK